MTIAVSSHVAGFQILVKKVTFGLSVPGGGGAVLHMAMGTVFYKQNFKFYLGILSRNCRAFY